MVALHYGVKTVFVIPEKFSQEKQELIKALGATIINTPTALGMKGAIDKALELTKSLEGAYYKTIL